MRTKASKTLTLKTHGVAPGYRDITLYLVCEAGREYRLNLGPGDVQRVIDMLAEVATCRPDGAPPLDWRIYPHPIEWPQVTPYRPK